MIRAGVIALGLTLSGGAQAWEFTPGLPCLLTYADDDVAVELTYDPTVPLYTISITTTGPWPDAPVFALRFKGPFAQTISTDRHVLGQQGRSLTVTDRGFSNVLNGMQFNTMMRGWSGGTEVYVPLTNAAAPVAAFRDCAGVPST